jgi:ribosome maturation factor RimP
VGRLPTFFVGAHFGGELVRLTEMIEPGSHADTIVGEDLEAEFAAITTHAGCELVHAQFKGGTLQLMIDRPEGGVTLADCELVSKQVSALLDVVDFSTRRYVLEVSSPGLDRPLYRARDYERFTGKLVRVTYFAAEGGKRTVVGRLEAYRPAGEGEITVTVTDTGERLDLPLGWIKTARLEIEL